MNYVIEKNQKPPFFLRGYRVLKPARYWLDKSLTTLTDNWLAKASRPSEKLMNRFAVPMTTGFRQQYHLLLANLETEVFLIHGNEVQSGKPFTLMYFGDKGNLRLLIYTFFGEGETTEEALGRCLFSKIEKVADQYLEKSDLIVIERNRNAHWVPKTGDWVRTPYRVRLVMDFEADVDVDAIDSKLKANMFYNYQKVRRMRFYPYYSNDPEDFDYFYTRMFVPLLQNRYGHVASYGSKVFYADIVKRKGGGILFTCLPDGKKVAGNLMYPQGDVLYALINGLLGGEKSLMNQGALASTYIFAVEYAVKQHFRRIDVGETLSMQNDGVFKHKKQWGFFPIESPWHVNEWLFWMPKVSEPALDWLSANPFLIEFAKWGGSHMKMIYEPTLDEA